MSDPFASGTPWDDGDPIAGDFTAEPARKIEFGGPIFQSKGQRAVKMKLPKTPKKTRDPDDILGERTARVVWKIIRWQRNLTVILFLLTVAGFTYSFAVGSGGKPIQFTFPTPLLGILDISPGAHDITPVFAALLGVLVSWMVASIIGLLITRPHGKFHRFTVRALIFAGVGAAIDLAMGGILSHILGQLVHTAPAHLPAKWWWVVDPSATPQANPSTPITPTPHPILRKR